MKPWLFDELKIFLDEININRLAEIGTHKGNTSLQLIKYLSAKNDYITFYGYDVFDFAKDNIKFNKKEFNGKGGASFSYVDNRLNNLKKQIKNFDYLLFEGLTKDTLEKQSFDFVYIDGGHSYETVKHDYLKTSTSKLIIFDDAKNKYNANQVPAFLSELEKEKEIEYFKRWAIIRNYA